MLKRIIARYRQAQQEREAVAPPDWEDTVLKMKSHPEIDNPWALAWWMKNEGMEPHNASSKTSALRHNTHDAITDINFEVMDATDAAEKALTSLSTKIKKLEAVIRSSESEQSDKQKAVKAAGHLDDAGKTALGALMKLGEAYDVLNRIIDQAGKDQPSPWGT